MKITSLFAGDRGEPVISALPVDLVGRWTDGSWLYEFAHDGSYYAGGEATAYSISADGQSLTLDSSTYVRQTRECEGIVGLWRNSSTEWHFRVDGSYTAHEIDGNSFDGIFEADGTNILRLEKRASVHANGNLLTFQPLWNVWEPAAYLRTGNELTLILGSNVLTWHAA